MRLLLTIALVAGFSAAAKSQPRWTAVQTLKLGGEADGPQLFSWPKAIDVDRQGRIWIYEHSAQEIRVFAADGKFVKTVGRKGRGPGELENAEGHAFGRDGRLWVRDGAARKLSVFDAEGAFQKTWVLQFCTSQQSWYPRFDTSGRIVDSDCMIRDGSGRESAILAYATDMSRIDTLGLVPQCGDPQLATSATFITRTARGTSYRAVPWAPRPVGTFSGDGLIWCAPTSGRYEILQTRLGGKDTVRITRSIALVPVTASEKDSVVRIIEARGPTGNDFSRIPATKPAIEGMGIDDLGRLWVRRTTASSLAEFDVFDATGKLVAVLQWPAGSMPSPYMPFRVKGDEIYAVIADADGVPFVVRMRIKR